MSKLFYFGHRRHVQTANSFTANAPVFPATGRQAVAESRFFDPSSCLPKGRCYPIPSFFEYRANPKEYDYTK